MSGLSSVLCPALLGAVLFASAIPASPVRAGEAEIRADVAAAGERFRYDLIAERIGDLIGSIARAEGQGALMQEGVRDAWDAARRSAFSAGAIQRELLRGVAIVPAPALAEVVAYYDTDLGARFLEAELDALTRGPSDADVAAREVTEAHARWSGLAPDDPLREAVARLLAASHSLEIETAAMSGLSYAIISGMLSATGSDVTLDEAEMQALCGCDPDTIRAALTESLPAIFLSIYEGFDAEEIDAYAAWHERDAVQAYLGAFSAAYVEIMHRRSRLFGAALVRALDQREG